MEAPLLELLHSGKVRDVYTDAGDIILVASDRISVYDVVLPTPIPDKGRILTQLSLWWFDKLGSLMPSLPNHVISDKQVPAEFRGRAVRCERLAMLPAEFIVRGYLAGLGLREYQATGSISGVKLQPGLHVASRLVKPIFTPTSKESVGVHDRPITQHKVGELIGSQQDALLLGSLAVELYGHATELTEPNGIIIADTKLEFGRRADGTYVLADEVLTPDSSRFWRAAEVQAGVEPDPLDKQYVRNWASDPSLGWDKTAPGPEIPADVVEATRQRYIDAYQLITGERWG